MSCPPHRVTILPVTAFLTFQAGYCLCGQWATYPKMLEDEGLAAVRFRRKEEQPTALEMRGRRI